MQIICAVLFSAERFQGSFRKIFDLLIFGKQVKLCASAAEKQGQMQGSAQML